MANTTSRIARMIKEQTLKFNDMDDDALDTLRVDVLTEQERRAALASIPEQASQLASRYLQASGVERGDPWVEPTGYENAYPEGWVTTHNGKEWTSTYDGNFTEPGVRGWREQTEEGTYPEYVPPGGYEDSYGVGDRVTFDGAVYECNTDGTTWSPTEAPGRWGLVTD